MTTKVVELPFFGGQDESVDKLLLPNDRLAAIKNCRISRQGRLEVRPQYTAQSQTTYDGGATMVAFDLVNYNGRLCALGDQTGQARATDLFEFVSGAAPWRATAGADTAVTSAPRIPRATDARQLGSLPDLDTDARYCCTAAVGGKLLMVLQLSGTARLHVFDPVTDQTLVLTTQPIGESRACFAGNNLWVVGQLVATNAIVGFRINPLTEKAFTQVTLVAAGTVGGACLDIACAQTGATDFTIAYTTGTNALAVRFDTSGTAQSNWTHVAASIDALGVCGNSGGTRVTVMWHDSTSKAFGLQTRTQTGGAIVGPTALFGGATETVLVRVGLAQQGTQICVLGSQSLTTAGMATSNIQSAIVTNEDTHAITATQIYADSILCSAPVGLTTNGTTNFYYGAVDRLADLAGSGTAQLIQQDQRLPQCFLAHALAGSQFTSLNSLGSCCKVGTKIYWGATVKSIAPRNPNEQTFGTSGVVVELEMAGTGRRPMTQLGNMLQIAGALPLTYEGRYLVEQGFAEKPVCAAVTAGGGGKSTGDYFVCTTWEIVDARQNILRADVSKVQKISLSAFAGTTAITVSSTTPHSLRRHPLWQADGGISLRVGFYSTIAGGANLFLESYTTVSGGNFGDPISTTLNAGDNQIQSNPVLYTQSQTPIPHSSPLPYRYAARTRERQFNAGLPQTEAWQASKLLFPFEPLEYAPPGRPGFSGRANQDVTGVASVDTIAIIFTLQEILQIHGRGPESDGTGDFDAARQIQSPGGCARWQSILAGPFGVFFQMVDDSLMIIGSTGNSSYGGSTGDSSASGGSPVGEVAWVGEPVVDTLTAYPVITGAVHVRNEMICAFSCNNNAGNDGVILVYDLSRKAWTVDPIGAPVSAISEYQGRLAYISNGVVFIEDAAIASGAGALPSMEATSGAYRFFTAMGWGDVPRVGVLGTFLGACTVELLIRYDDQTAFTSLGTQTVDGTTYVVGQAVPLIFQPLRRETTRFELKCLVTNATNTGAIRLHSFALELNGADLLSRLPAYAQR